MLGSQKNVLPDIPTLGVGFLRLTADCARRLILQLIHLLYNSRYGR